ncbi:uncharacterized mitochondrial protein AtMg00810-like [Andrographis paniculata]|uniref:uncharacterized mitochondrial protein AtMg00810-like n=1 Tax=Andrographis paniculata TaxID=175694 RepID=UPI0021E8BCCC|nr:uncharacterized mitochondrial protein AtMg00810-like [Andrographis paniculata]
MFIKLKGKDLMIAQVYVDDIVFGSTAESLKNEFIKFMEVEFVMSMISQLNNYFLGLQDKQLADSFFLSQTKYAQNMVEKFGLRDSKGVRTPLGQQDKLSKDDDGKTVDQKLYKSIIGSLLYLTVSRPDISFSVGVCARFQSTPKESHLKAAKRILKYVKGIEELGLWYSNRSDLDLIGFTDSDWAGCYDDRKSTTIGCFYIGDNIVSWSSKKQNSIALSTAEAEYIAAGSCCAQLLWIRQMLHDYGIGHDSFTLFCDNTSAINISKNPVQHGRTKHIDIRYHFIRDLVENEVCDLKHIGTNDQKADILTKALHADRFEKLQRDLGICSRSP